MTNLVQFLRFLPPLECLRFFEAAARHESFAKAATELFVTPAAVAHRIKRLEDYFGCKLFYRHSRGVRLNQFGRIYLKEIQDILTQLCDVTERHRNASTPRRLKIVAIEVVAEKWLMPRLAEYQAAQPDMVIELETDHRDADLGLRDFHIWITFTRKDAGEMPDAVTLFEETLLPVCSPALLAARGQPRKPADLHDWPLLYDLIWDSDWSYWFASQGVRAPDLLRASGFRLYSMVIQAAVEGIGVALGHSSMIAHELEQGTLVSLFKTPVAAPARCVLVTSPHARSIPDVQLFREWLLDQARLLEVRARPDAAPSLGET